MIFFDMEGVRGSIPLPPTIKHQQNKILLASRRWDGFAVGKSVPTLYPPKGREVAQQRLEAGGWFLRNL
jgi:hypothetical protein